MSATLRLSIVTPAHWKAFMGGAQYQVKCILDALVPTGRYDIEYFARRTDPTFTPDGYRIRTIGSGGGVPRWGYLADSRLLYGALREARPDVIYQRVGCGYTGIAAYYARRHGARMIWHVAHDSDVERGAALGTRNPIRAYLEKRAMEYGLRHADHIVTQTQQQATQLLKHYGRHASAVIPNFHPVPEEEIDKSGPLTVLWVANFKQWKRPEAFVRLADRLRDLEGVRFVMVGAPAGGADSQWNESVMQAIRGTPNVDYVGQKTQGEVNALLARAHLFVNTSEQEGFANTFIQAWMREVPVISLGVNPDDLFDREDVGFCAGSEEELARVVRSLVADEERRNRMAKTAGAYAMGRHSIRNIDALVQLIEGAKPAPGVAG